MSGGGQRTGGVAEASHMIANNGAWTVGTPSSAKAPKHRHATSFWLSR